MIPFYLAIAVACLAFWRIAWKILAVVAIFMLVSGLVMFVNDLHHMVR